MGKQLSMAASIFFMAIVALTAIGEAAIVEHTFVVSKHSMLPLVVDPADSSAAMPEFVILLYISQLQRSNCRSMR
jgi:hypothetical protein